MTVAALQPHSKVKAYLQLFRLPNLFTAIADICMGFLVVFGTFQPAMYFGLLLVASCLFYTAGMVLNDVFDVEVDRAERPHRPIPSGRISAGCAKWIGYQMLFIGLLCAAAVAYFAEQPRVLLTAVALVASVLLYDGLLKKTVLGPVAMGACRFFNVLLGMSLLPGPWQSFHWLLAGGVGVYIVGVTWFARTEASISSRLQLAGAAVVAMLGIGMIASFPYLLSVEQLTQLRWLGFNRWQMLWMLLGLIIGWRFLRAVATPTPPVVQYTIKQSILSLITIHAAIVFCFAGLQFAIIVLLLLIPALFLGRWIYST